MTDDPRVELLERSFAAVGLVIEAIGAGQWTLPTPCAEWDVSRVVHHLVGMNRVFTAMLTGAPPPERGADLPVGELPAAFRESAGSLLAVFRGPGVLEQSFAGPLGSATGAERLMIRLYDLLAHGWDLARATGQALALPEDAAEQALGFARRQLQDDARGGRFAAPQQVPGDAPAIERLVAFLGRAL